MAEKHTGGFAVPDVEEAIDIEETIEGLKHHIENKCAGLLHRAIAINAVADKQFRIRFWENKIDQIRQNGANAFSVTELEELKLQANILELDMEQFSKRLR
ncbi:hypothetical protein HY988_03050 [Candidatus Micrarchaeota archaeon]|nr:hypothetical protein [Candidatus Micrarchaeota archaeon]